MRMKFGACLLVAGAIALSAAPGIACELGGKYKGAAHSVQSNLSHHKITLQVQDATLSKVLDLIAKKGGFQVQFEKGVARNQRVTANLNDVDLKSAVESVLATKGLVGSWNGANLKIKKLKVAARQH